MPNRPTNTIVGQIDNGFLGRMMLFSPPAVVVWLALANRADKGGRSHPSIGTLQADTGLARSTVCKGLKELAEASEITITPGGGQGNPSNQYTITGSTGNELVQSANQSKPRTKVVREMDQGSTGNELKPNTRTKHKNQTHGKSALTLDQLIEKWNQIDGVRHCRDATETRQDAFRARCQDAKWITGIPEALEKVGKSQFLRGGGEKGWRAGIDFLLKPDTLTKILEGEYDSRNGNGHPKQKLVYRA